MPLGLAVAGVEWSLTWPGIGIALDSCSRDMALEGLVVAAGAEPAAASAAAVSGKEPSFAPPVLGTVPAGEDCAAVAAAPWGRLDSGRLQALRLLPAASSAVQTRANR